MRLIFIEYVEFEVFFLIKAKTDIFCSCHDVRGIFEGGGIDSLSFFGLEFF